MQNSNPPTTQCTMCHKPTVQLCKTCRCSRYCSRKCQKDDWPVHKLLCSQFAIARFSAPPQASFKRAILFPQLSETDLSMAPRFVWIPSGFHLGAGTDPRSDEVFFEHIAELSLRGIASLDRGNLRFRALSAEILVLDIGGDTKVQANSCVRALTAGADAFVGSGPVIAVKLAGSEGYADMDTVDFRTVVDLFNFPPAPVPGQPSTGTLVPQFHDRRRIPAMRINCPGDLKAGGRAKFEAISVPQHHAVARAPVTEISKRVGFPIRVIRCSGNETLYRPHLVGASFEPTNQAATFLQLGTDPESTGFPSWGFVPFDWMDPAGSVVVVRKDLQYLYPSHLEALCYYCRYVLLPLFEDSSGAGLHPDRPFEKRKVLERMTPREFENFYTGWAAAMRDSDPHWGARGQSHLVLD